MARTKKPAVAPGTPFSLGGGGPSMVGAHTFSLDARPKGVERPITVDMPDTGKKLPGEALSLEGEAAQELDELQEQFGNKKLSAAEFNVKKARETARKDVALDATYWAGIVFATTADLNQFLAGLGVPIYGQFLDGYEVAKKLGIHVTRTPLEYPIVNVLDMWSDLALEVPPPPDPSVPEGFDPDFE